MSTRSQGVVQFSRISHSGQNHSCLRAQKQREDVVIGTWGDGDAERTWAIRRGDALFSKRMQPHDG